MIPLLGLGFFSGLLLLSLSLPLSGEQRIQSPLSIFLHFLLHIHHLSGSACFSRLLLYPAHPGR